MKTATKLISFPVWLVHVPRLWPRDVAADVLGPYLLARRLLPSCVGYHPAELSTRPSNFLPTSLAEHMKMSSPHAVA